MASDYRKFVGYTVEELEEDFPELLDEDLFACVSYRPDDIQQVYISKNPKNRRYIAIEYWDGQVMLCDEVEMKEVNFADLYYYLNQPSLYRVRKSNL